MDFQRANAADRHSDLDEKGNVLVTDKFQYG
jgi:hypothetical protein